MYQRKENRLRDDKTKHITQKAITRARQIQTSETKDSRISENKTSFLFALPVSANQPQASSYRDLVSNWLPLWKGNSNTGYKRQKEREVEGGTTGPPSVCFSVCLLLFTSSFCLFTSVWFFCLLLPSTSSAFSSSAFFLLYPGSSFCLLLLSPLSTFSVSLLHLPPSSTSSLSLLRLTPPPASSVFLLHLLPLHVPSSASFIYLFLLSSFSS